MTRPARVAFSTISMCSAMSIDLAEDRVERVLQRFVDRIPLSCPQLVEVRVNPVERFGSGVTVAALQIPHHFVAREYGARDVIVDDGVAWHGFSRPGVRSACTLPT